MTLNRIQKLLFSEYSDFEDMVLVESPFAETTRDGRGIRQVQIGLTPTKLVLATDIIKKATDYPITFFPGCIDAEIECLELISIFPIELVSLSIFRRRRRKVLKAKFHDGNPNHNCKIVYFELGGSEKRKMFWNLWCERVKFLSPEDKGNSSLTETSVASSTSISSLHVAKTRISNDKIWQYYAGGEAGKDSSEKINLRWTDRDLFFGDKHELVDSKFEAISYATVLENDVDEIRTLYRRRCFPISLSSAVHSSSKESRESMDSIKKAAEHINRFGEGIDENCKTGLYLPAISYSTAGGQGVSSCSDEPKVRMTSSSFKRMCEEGVEIWESVKKLKTDRHPRKYGFTASSDLYYCFGEYFLGRGETFSVQVKKSPSEICVYDEIAKEPEFEKPSNRFFLCNSPSYESFRPWGVHAYVDHSPVNFWTTDCWYRPTSLKKIYKECHVYLNHVRLFLKKRSNTKLTKKIRFMNFGKKFLKSSKIFYLNSDDSLPDVKKKLKLDNLPCVWDIDSSSLAFQITMIDAQLFLKIPVIELELLLRHKNGKSSINLMNWLLFSHRVSCLIATAITRMDVIKYRARLIARFVNAAEKCHLLHNYQSCRSLLNGLQSPAIHRLKKTWSHVRHYHATKYQMFEKLCRLYKDPRLFCYQKSFYKSSHGQPYLPSAVHLLAILLGKVFEKPVSSSWSSSTLSQYSDIADRKKISIVERCRAVHHKTSMPKILKQIFSALKIYPNDKNCVQSDGDKSSVCSNNNDNTVEVTPFFDEPENVKCCRNGIEDATELFINAQKAATKYDLGENVLASEFLLKVPYKELEANYYLSLRIEPD